MNPLDAHVVSCPTCTKSLEWYLNWRLLLHTTISAFYSIMDISQGVQIRMFLLSYQVCLFVGADIQKFANLSKQEKLISLYYIHFNSSMKFRKYLVASSNVHRCCKYLSIVPTTYISLSTQYILRNVCTTGKQRIAQWVFTRFIKYYLGI